MYFLSFIFIDVSAWRLWISLVSALSISCARIVAVFYFHYLLKSGLILVFILPTHCIPVYLVLYSFYLVSMLAFLKKWSSSIISKKKKQPSKTWSPSFFACFSSHFLANTHLWRTKLKFKNSSLIPVNLQYQPSYEPFWEVNRIPSAVDFKNSILTYEF